MHMCGKKIGVSLPTCNNYIYEILNYFTGKIVTLYFMHIQIQESIFYKATGIKTFSINTVCNP